MRRSLYLVIFAVLIAALAVGGYYYRHHSVAAAAAKTAAGCDTPAPAPPPKPTEPKVPDFLETACGPAANTSKAGQATPKK